MIDKNSLPSTEAFVAQWLEHWSCKPGAESSILSEGKSFILSLLFSILTLLIGERFHFLSNINHHQMRSQLKSGSKSESMSAIIEMEKFLMLLASRSVSIRDCGYSQADTAAQRTHTHTFTLYRVHSKI